MTVIIDNHTKDIVDKLMSWNKYQTALTGYEQNQEIIALFNDLGIKVDIKRAEYFRQNETSRAKYLSNAISDVALNPEIKNVIGRAKYNTGFLVSRTAESGACSWCISKETSPVDYATFSANSNFGKHPYCECRIALSTTDGKVIKELRAY